MPSNFCFHPWVGLDIDPQGNLKPCCKYQYSISDNIDEYFSSTHLEDLKKEFLSDKRPEGCKRCWDDENAGLPSKRQIDAKFSVDKNTSLELDSLKFLGIPFGNTCNLACRTCSSFSSSKWRGEELKTKNVHVYPHKKFYKNMEFMDKIKSISDDLIDIQFHGGEPFLTGIPEHHDFLNFLLNKTPSNITLKYITNATIFPDDEFWQKFSKFKKIDICLSIDGIDNQFEYIRWPASWEVCYDNIKRYQAKNKELNNMQLSISHTVSVFNVYYLPKFYKWCLQEKLPLPYLGMVESPDIFNISKLPLEIKTKISDNLSSKFFDSVNNFMNNGTSSNVENLLDSIRHLDITRKQDFFGTFPEFSTLLIK